MKCRLCDRPAATGTGKLCTDCGKALRRARGVSLSRLPPLAAVQPMAATPISLTCPEPPAGVPRANRTVLWAGAALVTMALLYLAAQELVARRGDGAPGTTHSPTPSMTERVKVEPSPPAVTRVEEPSWTAVAPVEANVPHLPVAASAKGPVAAASAKTGAKTAKAATQDANPSPPTREYGAPAPKATEPEAAHQLAGGKAVEPLQPVDGAQRLASAMQKCGNEALLAKFICEQKAYFKYCEDKWDKDPRCMRKTVER